MGRSEWTVIIAAFLDGMGWMEFFGWILEGIMNWMGGVGAALIDVSTLPIHTG